MEGLRKLIMKYFKIILGASLAIFAGGALLVSTQDPGTPPEASTESAPTETKAPVKKAKKPVKKKKKPAPKPVSEYKFSQIDTIPAYKFDKQTNPIIKAPPKKKAAKKAVVKKAASSQPAAKLKKAPPIDADGQVKQGALPEAPPQQPTGD